MVRLGVAVVVGVACLCWFLSMVSASVEQLTCYVIGPLAEIVNLVKECHPFGKDSQVKGMEGARALSIPKGVVPLKSSVQECHPQGKDSRT